jgi:hypothetical protein
MKKWCDGMITSLGEVKRDNYDTFKHFYGVTGIKHVQNTCNSCSCGKQSTQHLLKEVA